MSSVIAASNIGFRSGLPVEKIAAKPATNGAGSSRAPPIRDLTRRS
jgi:hypothetical protein